MKKIIFTLGLLLHAVMLVAQEDIGALLKQLDETIRQHDIYVQQKTTEINKLKEALRHATEKERKYTLLQELYTEYNSHNGDSALVATKELDELARQNKDEKYQLYARLYLAEIQSKGGLFKEALDQINAVDRSVVSDDVLPLYYHIYRSTYGFMAEYSLSTSQKQEYLRLADVYRDSILSVNNPESLAYATVHADHLNAHNQPDRAIALLNDYQGKHPEALRNPMFTYTFSESYRLKNDLTNREKYLLFSAIGDIQSASKEYVSLRELAVLLYQQGDIDRAYQYMKTCMEDASFYNARLRIVQILKMFPVINETYQEKMISQQRTMMLLLTGISLLALFLLFAIFYVYKQRKLVIDINSKLKEVNGKLHNSNEKLKEVNHSLAESSYIKEEYIGQYIDQCSVYIKKIDEYRHTLNSIASHGSVKELIAKIKSTQFIEDELKEFYDNFDKTFLQLFPSFVDDFNALLAESERIQLPSKEKGLLNTELRIFALIRLGITDSVKIAQFLRYSVRTIYNYRTKMRNKAAGNRDEFEKEVMKIGKLREQP